MVWKKNRHCPDPSHSRVRANGVSYFPYSIPKIEDILQDELFSPWGYLLIYFIYGIFHVWSMPVDHVVGSDHANGGAQQNETCYIMMNKYTFNENNLYLLSIFCLYMFLYLY